MNEFIKERFSYLADNKKENAPELNVSYGIDKNFFVWCWRFNFFRFD